MSTSSLVAKILTSASRAYATAAVEWQQEHDPASVVKDASWSDQVRDAENRIFQLSEALAIGRPELFVEQAAWLEVLHASRGAKGAIPAGLRALKAALEEKLAPTFLPQVTAHLDQAVARAEQAGDSEPSFVDGDGPERALARQYLLAGLEGRRREAIETITDALEGGMTPDVLREQVLGRAQAELGRLWHLGQLHAGEEHFVTRITEHVMSILQDRQGPTDPAGRRVLCTTVGGELHSIGLRIVAEAFETAGWETIYLGASIPDQDVVRSVRDFAPDLVALSVNLIIHLSQARETIQNLRKDPELADTPVLVGGQPFRWADDLHETLGADGVAFDVGGAVRVGKALVDARRNGAADPA